MRDFFITFGQINNYGESNRSGNFRKEDQN